MEVLELELITKRGFHALNSNIHAWKELPIEQYHVWMIAWSVGGLTKQGRASAEAASFGELEATSTTRLMA
ncbi:hypothetical protein KY285_000920 [Solanum tuberosum]|nr:hypothetical protein KY285_000920 [Solanum tuberosum]